MSAMMLDLFGEVAAAHKRVPAFVKRSRVVKDAPWLPTLIVIPDDGCVYKDCQIELPSEYYIGNNGFGCAVFRREGVDTLWTAHGIVDLGIGRVVDA